MSTPTTAPDYTETIARAGRFVQQLGRVAFVLVLVALPVALYVRHRRRRPWDEWEHRADGSVRGPRWYRWRIKRALQPLVNLAGRHAPETPEAWAELGERMTPVMARRLARLWPDVAAALEWPSRFHAYDVDLGLRVLDVRAVATKTSEQVARVLYELDVIAHTSGVTVDRLDDEPGVVRVVIMDATSETLTTEHEHLVRAPRDTEHVRAGDVVEVRRITVETGTRWTSKYDPSVCWVDPTDEPDISGHEPLPQGPGMPVVRGAEAQLTTTTGQAVSGNGERLTDAQWAALRMVHRLGLAAGTDVADRLGADRGNTHRTLTTLMRRQLVHRPEAGDRRWQCTELGVSVLGLTPAGWAPPTGQTPEVTP